MDRSTKRLVAVTELACLLVVAGNLQTSHAKNSGSGGQARIQGSIIPLNSMDGLELRDLNHPGAVRIVNVEGQSVKTEGASAALTQLRGLAGEW